MIIREFKKEDIDNFDYNGIERGYLTELEIRQNIRHYTRNGNAWTGVDKDIVGIGGISNLGKGVGYCWLYLNKECREHLITVITYIKKVIKESDYRRIQAMCLQNKEAIKLIEYLGFKKEGTMRQLLPGEDINLYSIIRGEL